MGQKSSTHLTVATIPEREAEPEAAESEHSASSGTRRGFGIKKSAGGSTLFKKFSELDLTSEEPCRDPTLDFPFLQDNVTVNYIKGSKVMFIMRGLSGSGKTTLTKYLQTKYPDAIVCSADHFFMKNGRYEWDKSRLKDAHAAALKKATKLCTSDKHVVIIDNTNVKCWEMTAYWNIAHENMYSVVLVEPKTAWKFDPDELVNKSVHSVPLNIIEGRLKQWDTAIPIYCGWFLNTADSQMLEVVGQAWLEECLRVQEFYNDFKTFSTRNTVHRMLGYYSRDTFVHGGRVMHCTSKFLGRGNISNTGEYLQIPEVVNANGRCYTLHIIGFVITPRTFGARIKLTEEQLKLWGQNDLEKISVTSPRKYVMSTQKAPGTSGSHNSATSSIPKPKKLNSKLFYDKCIATLLCIPQDDDVLDNMSPVTGVGSRAHITLGCGPAITPQTTGIDLVEVVECEAVAQQDIETAKTYALPAGYLRCYGKSRWVVYPSKQMIVNSLFTGYL